MLLDNNSRTPHNDWLPVTHTVMSVPLVSGDLPAARRGKQGEGVPNAPDQHRWGGGHVYAGRAPRSRHHA